MLPFAFVNYIPVMIYLGKIRAEEVFKALYLWTFTRITIREGAFDRYLLCLSGYAAAAFFISYSYFNSAVITMKGGKLSGVVDIFGIIGYNSDDVISNMVCKKYHEC